MSDIESMRTETQKTLQSLAAKIHPRTEGRAAEGLAGEGAAGFAEARAQGVSSDPPCEEVQELIR